MKQQTKYLKIILIAPIVLLSNIILYQVLISRMAPAEYVAIIIGCALISSLAVWILLSYKRKSFRIAGIVIATLTILLLALGCYGLNTAKTAIKKITNQSTQTSTIVVAVKKEDPAQSLNDIVNYNIGRQSAAHQKETDQMLKKIKTEENPELNITMYDTIQAEANALLSGEIQAAVYAENFTDILNESIENYSEQIRILSSDEITTETEVEPETAKQDVTEPFCIYLSGIDTSGPVNSTGRSDVNIIMAVNPNTHGILLVSTPRDYYVPIPGISGGARDKLTHAGIYGPDASIRTLETLYDIQIPYYAKLNFTSLITIIDALGGIDVPVEQSFSSGGYRFNEGIQHMTGKQALAFCRERKTFSDGDLQRGRNQETVLTAIIHKAATPEIVLHATELVNQLGHTVTTSLSSEDIMSLINLQLSDMADWNVTSLSANGTGDTQPCYSYGSRPLSVVRPDMASVNELSTAIKKHQKS